jgi:hypothetical protein
MGRIYSRGEYISSMSEQAQKLRDKAIAEWAKGIYCAQGVFEEALVYYDDEALYLEHRGQDSGVVRFPFEMLKTLGEVIEEE